MLRKRIVSMAAAAGLAGMLMTFTSAGPASAHEERKVGNYMFHVGFGDEPAFAGAKNSVQLLLHDAKTDKPVTSIGDQLKVDVTQGDAAAGDTQKLSMNVEPDFEVGEFGTPGDYRAFFIPTTPGSYSFHFTGSINGQKVDEKFTSGPNTFSNADDPAAIQFPIKQPTGAQVSARVDRENLRLNQALADARKQAKDQAGTARTIAIVGLVVGVLGLAAAAYGLTRKRA